MVEHTRYEKISDKIMDLTYYSMLKINVILGHKDKNNRRLNYHREYSYQTDKYRNISTLYGISRNFDSYLSIESYLDGKNGEKDFIMIRDENMIQLRFVLSRIYKLWIELGEQQKVYVRKGNKVIVPRDTWNTEIVDLCMGKKIAFEPTVIKSPDGSEEKGIDILLNSNYNKITLNHNKFMGFIYNINSIHIFQLAQNMINYLQRPELGINMTTFGNYEQEEKNNYIGGADSIQKGNSSVVTRKKNHSIFDEL